MTADRKVRMPCMKKYMHKTKTNSEWNGTLRYHENLFWIDISSSFFQFNFFVIGVFAANLKRRVVFELLTLERITTNMWHTVYHIQCFYMIIRNSDQFIHAMHTRLCNLKLCIAGNIIICYSLIRKNTFELRKISIGRREKIFKIYCRP